jgi:hypothetical protein
VTVSGASGVLSDALSYETNDGCSADVTDTDGDGLPDVWERAYGLAAGDPSDASLDSDGDGRTNAQERADATHPLGRYTRYLAEGASGPYFTTRISFANPGETSATVLLRVLTDAGQTLPRCLTVPALEKRTLVVNRDIAGAAHAAFSTVVESDARIVVDRTMFWNADAFGSHAETSVPAPSLRWYLAEGATHGNFFLFYLLQNPSLTTVAQVRIRYLIPSGVPIERVYHLQPRSRYTIEVDKVPGLEETDVSADIEVQNGVPIIAERAMYSIDPANPGLGFVAGHESAGVVAPSTNWFLAEGATGSFFDFFVLFANPNDTAADLRVTYLLENGTTVEKRHTVPANARRTVYVATEDPRLASTSLSTRVESTNGVPIVVERAMWWPHGETWQEAHNSAGSTQTGVKWALAEGETGDLPANTRTYVLVANTSASVASVRVTLLFGDGRAPLVKTVGVLANSRKTLDIATMFPETGATSYGIVVESLTGEQIVVERAMYSNAQGVFWSAGSNALATKLR